MLEREEVKTLQPVLNAMVKTNGPLNYLDIINAINRVSRWPYLGTYQNVYDYKWRVIVNPDRLEMIDMWTTEQFEQLCGLLQILATAHMDILLIIDAINMLRPGGLISFDRVSNTVDFNLDV